MIVFNINLNYRRIILSLLFTLPWLMFTFLWYNDFLQEIEKWEYWPLLILLPIIWWIGSIIYHILVILRWKININIKDNKHFSSWEIIRWNIDLKVNKYINKWKLYVYFRWYMRRSNSSRNGKSLKKSYEQKIELEKDKIYRVWYTNNYKFEFKIPFLTWSRKWTKSIVEKTIRKDSEFNEEDIQKQLKLANKMLNFMWAGKADYSKDCIDRWQIEVLLENEWINLYNWRIINVTRTLKN